MERRVRATSTDGFGPGIARDRGSTRDTRDGSWRRWKMAARSGWSPPRARREALRCKKGAKGTTAGQSGRKSKKLTHLFEYDGAGAWKMALLMSDTCSAHEDSKGSSQDLVELGVLAAPGAEVTPHLDAAEHRVRSVFSRCASAQPISPRDARRDGRVNYRAAPTVFTRVCVIRTPFPREHTLRANPRRRSATGGALTVPTDATFRARCGERERGLSNLCRIFGPPDDSERDRGDFRRIRVPRRRGWSPDFAKKRCDRSTEPSLLLARPHARLDCAVRFPPPPSANNVTQE